MKICPGGIQCALITCLNTYKRMRIMIVSFLCSDSKFRKSDAFIGFQKDTPASVIFQATNELRSVGCNADLAQFILEWKQLYSLESMEDEGSELQWEKAVS